MRAPKISTPVLIKIILTALFAALNIVLSQIHFQLGPVPIVLTQVSIFLAAGLLGWKWGTLSQIVYIAMGAAGLPVFSGFRGGLAVLTGPTGGYIFGYILSALVIGLLLDKFCNPSRVGVFLALIAGLLVIYVPGLPWLMHSNHLNLKETLLTGMLPFLPGDLLKAALAGTLILSLRKALKKAMPAIRKTNENS